MEAIAYLYQSFLPILAIFGTFNIISSLNYSNVACTCLIVFLSFMGYVYEAMGTFINYLIIDMLWRDHQMPLEIKAHHIGCVILTLLGLLIALGLPKHEQITTKIAIGHLLNMEITTPFLHAAKQFNKDGYSIAAGLTLLFLIVLWIPFRLIYPFVALYELSLLKTEQFSLNVCCSLIVALLVLQTMWFFRLCVLFMGAVSKTLKI